MSEEPTRILVGVFGEGVPDVIVVPRDTLKPAERILDRDRAQRLAAASKPKIEALRAARARGRLKKALNAVLRRGRGP
jgi:hypothetical protein